MVNWIKSLSQRSEFVGVLTLAFGASIWQSLSMALSPQPLTAVFDNASLSGLMATQLATLAIIGAFLYLRGWTWARLGPAPRWRDLPQGFGLAAATLVGFWVFHAAAALTGLLPADADDSARVAPDLDWRLMFAASAVNGFFEEALVCGYLVSALRERPSMWTAIHLSTAIRASYHLYQGEAGAVMVPMGLAFAWLYSVNGRLWPLVVAHIALDALALFAR